MRKYDGFKSCKWLQIDIDQEFRIEFNRKQSSWLMAKLAIWHLFHFFNRIGSNFAWRRGKFRECNKTYISFVLSDECFSQTNRHLSSRNNNSSSRLTTVDEAIKNNNWFFMLKVDDTKKMCKRNRKLFRLKWNERTREIFILRMRRWVWKCL